jgi:hypothetical protein
MIFFKEIRENARWAALMALLLAVLMANSLNAMASDGESIVGIGFLSVTSTGFAACGLALGLLQALQDRRRGRWDVVIHRPVSRTNIFLGKVVAGMLLYTVASGVAFGAAIVWSATPGHVAGPFEWHMVLPGLADLLGGWVWYAAGLLVGLRPARWIGSRLMPLGAAVLCSMVATGFAITLTQALLVISAGVLIILPAAWASFVSAGQYERQPVVARALQTICVGAGVGVTVVVAMGIVSETLRMLVRYDSPDIGVRYVMDQDDKIYRITYSTTGSIEISNISDPQGQVLSPTAARRVMASQLETSYFVLGESNIARLPWSTRLRLQGYRRAETYIRRLGMQTLSGGVMRFDVGVTDRPFNLFYVAGRQTIEGYDLQFRHRTMGISPGGFTTGSERAQPFPQPLTRFSMLQGERWILATATDAWELDMREAASIRQMHHTTPDDPIFDVGGFPAVPDNAARTSYATIVTRSAIHISIPNGPVLRLPIEHAYPQCQMVQVGRTNDHRYVAWYTAPAGDSQTSWIVETDESGKVVRRTELPPHPSPAVPSAWWFHAMEVAALPPPILAKGRTAGDPLAIVVLSIAGFASAIAAWVLCKRSAFGWHAALTWSALGLLAGWAALLTLLCVREQPTRVRCPKCGRRRVVTRARCEHCGAEFDPPQAEGIEIFETETSNEVNHATMALRVG